MSSLNSAKSSGAKHELTIYGYVRENFDKKCWIDEIIAIIIVFYVEQGGSLYMCGRGNDGRLGIKEYKNKTCKVFTLCPPFTQDNVLQMSAGYHTLILDIDGDIWSWGLDEFEEGALGHGHRNSLDVPTKLNVNARIIAVSAGASHSLLLTQDDLVKSFGSNYRGQIGHGDLPRSLTPKTIESLTQYKIVQIWAGAKYSAVLTAGGELFCFGDNRSGQCGVGKDKGKYITTPIQVQMNENVAFVECRMEHTLLITKSGLIWSFGCGESGKLGHGSEVRFWTPSLIESLKHITVTKCAAGEKHSLCVDKDGIVWSFGCNDAGQCGLSEDIEEVFTPTRIEWFISNNIKAKECAASDRQSSIIAEDGNVYVFGSNDDYCLGLSEVGSYYTPTKILLPENTVVRKVCMGYEHTGIICTKTIRNPLSTTK